MRMRLVLTAIAHKYASVGITACENAKSVEKLNSHNRERDAVEPHLARVRWNSTHTHTHTRAFHVCVMKWKKTRDL